MASNGVRDRVAIVGMGCTQFGERWDKGTDNLLTGRQDAIASAGVKLDDIDSFWLGTMGSGSAGLTLSRPLKLDYRPVTHIENFCATGSEALRNACYTVASALRPGHGDRCRKAEGQRLLGPDRRALRG